MRVSIFGMGYVGSVTAACLGRDGHEVIGVDVSQDKVDRLNLGKSSIIEPQLGEITEEVVRAGKLKATTNTPKAIAESDLSLICVGTPSNESGSLDLQYVRRVCEEVGRALHKKSTWHTVVLRSTMLPGSTEEVVIPILDETSGKTAGIDFGVCFNPEFLRESTAIKDFYDPPRTVIGSIDTRSGDALANLYSHIDAPLVRTNVRTAEMVKYVDNAFHALKIVFSNEVGRLCKNMDIDSHRVMDIFVLDTKLNLSKAYLKPGYAFGGSCLPKDLRALRYKAKEINVEVPLLEAVLESNEIQKRRGFQLVQKTGCKKVGILGLSFKDHTDDLRESPYVELAEMLVGKGYEVMIYDENVSLSSLMGANLAYIQRELPHLSKLLCSTVDEILDSAEVVVLTNNHVPLDDILKKLRPAQHLIDLARAVPQDNYISCKYEGICW